MEQRVVAGEDSTGGHDCHRQRGGGPLLARRRRHCRDGTDRLNAGNHTVRLGHEILGIRHSGSDRTVEESGGERGGGCSGEETARAGHGTPRATGKDGFLRRRRPKT